jgi:hypothetical protein
MELLFSERQRFTQWWLWLLLGAINLLFLIGLYQQLVRGVPFGNNPAPNGVLIGVLVFTLGLSWWFWRLELCTEIDAQEIRVVFSPFTRQTISWKDVASAEVVDYGFVGGWGMRFGTKYGTIYNVAGRMGLALVLENGKQLCIGTQEAAQLQRVLTNLTREQAGSGV